MEEILAKMRAAVVPRKEGVRQEGRLRGEERRGDVRDEGDAVGTG